MCLNCRLGLILMCVCYASGVVDIEAKTPHGTCTYVDESCIHGHHVSKDLEAILSKNHQSPKFTSRQYFILYGISS